MYHTELCTVAQMDIAKTFDCGQCFRFNRQDDGSYLGTAFGRTVKLWQENERVYIDAPECDLTIWHSFFDLELDYAAITEGFYHGEYMEKCIDFGRGIRILRQDKWEALCSFIISQCNNIPRIKGIVEALCKNFGEPIDYLGQVHYSFPTAERIARLDESELAIIRSGYRANYISCAARAVCSGEINFDELDIMDHKTALKAVLGIRGVGVKVANCFILFGLHKMEAFPIDVWMKKALKENFEAGFDHRVFGDYAGLAQQYIFYYARSGDN